MMNLVVIVVVCLLIGYSFADTSPQQIHLSLTGTSGQMCVGWVTEDDTATSTVIYWAENSNTNLTAQGTSDHYYLVIPPYKSPQIHFTTLTGLQLNTKYYYTCGDPQGGYSDVFYFNTERNKPLVIASLADHGTSPNSSQVVNALLHAEANGYDFDLLVHAGDISYANDEQSYWDLWANMVQPFANHIPWMTAVGNHEILDDFFVAYDYRFQMPGDGDGNMYYSFNYGPVHFLMADSESVEYWHFLEQYQWLEQDLASVDRTATPWIIALWHTQWYCSNHAHYQAGEDMRMSYEDLFNKYAVDLVLNGHVHAYERSVPVYNYNATAGAPVYITNGAGGTEEGIEYGWYDQPAWSVARHSEWGIGILQVLNSTHMYWEFHNSNNYTVVDSTWIIKQS